MQPQNLDTYELEYDDFSFKLIIPEYWIKIYNGKKREPLYHDYRMMLDLLKKTSKEKYVLDIGANHGLFAVPASILGYKVIGFEPVAANIETLQLAKEANGLSDFDMFHLALSNKNEEVEIFVPECPDNSSLSQDAAVSNMVRKGCRSEKVNAVRFDDWIKEHSEYSNVGLIKMDTQGAEYSIIEGAKEFLTAARDVYLISEYEHHLFKLGHTFEELDNLILSCGFQYVRNLSPNDKIFYKP